MALSSRKPKLHDPIRKRWVSATPEEIIRQRLIKKMVEKLGFPPPLLAIEKELSALPHLFGHPKSSLPKRRADILAFAKDIHKRFSLYPLLMIECKAVAITPPFVQQVVGYNEVVQAPYVALANETTTLLGYFDERCGHLKFEEKFPSYNELIRQLEK